MATQRQTTIVSLTCEEVSGLLLLLEMEEKRMLGCAPPDTWNHAAQQRFSSIQAFKRQVFSAAIVDGNACAICGYPLAGGQCANCNQ